MPTFARIYTGDDGLSCIEDIEPPFGAPEPDGLEEAVAQGATRIIFRRAPPGHFLDFHTAPRRQYTITLSGEIEIGAGDGTIRRFGPGSVLLAEDVTGGGHTTRVVGVEPRVSVIIPLSE